MVYKLRVTKTYYFVRRGNKRYKYVKLIVNLPPDEKLLNVDYVYILTPEEYEALVKMQSAGTKVESIEEPVRAQVQLAQGMQNKRSVTCDYIRQVAFQVFQGKKYVKYEIFLQELKKCGIEVCEDILKRCFTIENKGREKGLYVKLRD